MPLRWLLKPWASLAPLARPQRSVSRRARLEKHIDGGTTCSRQGQDSKVADAMADEKPEAIQLAARMHQKVLRSKDPKKKFLGIVLGA